MKTVGRFIDFAIEKGLDPETIRACAEYVDGPLHDYDGGARAGLCEELKYVAEEVEKNNGRK